MTTPNPDTALAAVLLAAGGSRRLGRPKQLLALDGKTLVRRAAEAARDAGFAPVFAVVGAHAEAVWREVADLALRVDNAAFEEGIASSIRAGIGAVERANPACRGALVFLVDQPRVDATLLRRIRERFDGKGIVACAYGDSVGTPALFPKRRFAELLALRGDRGAKPILEAQRAELVSLPFPEGGVDLDTETDAAHLGAR